MERAELTSSQLAELLPVPRGDANKYTRGKLVCVVGSARYTGSAVLCARASERMGAGYTQVFTHPDAVALVRAASASLVAGPFQGLSERDLRPNAPTHPLAVLVGCGFSADDPRERTLLAQVLQEAEAPLCIDGGALGMLADEAARVLLASCGKRGLATVLTPHGGEAARLARAVGVPLGEGPQLACALARAYGGVVVLKGPVTYVAEGDRFFEMGRGTSALAKAGTGDVLAGMVGALLAQGLSAFDAAALGATLHALAGRAAEERLGSISVTADDLPLSIPRAIELLRAGA